jgi:LasA protease
VSLLAAASLACSVLAAPGGTAPDLNIPTATIPPTLTPASTAAVAAIETVLPGALVTAVPAATETPPEHVQPTMPAVDVQGNYTVQPGDTLEALTRRFRTDAAAIVLRNPSLVALGFAQAQTLPPGMRLDLPLAGVPANAFAIPLMPDSEVVYSPGAAGFDVRDFVLAQPGFLASYYQAIEPGQPPKAGWEIVSQYARNYSLNPRLLLALLEFQSGALSNPNPAPEVRAHPLGATGPEMQAGLSHQLGWLGNQLNYGYYGWRSGAILNFSLADGAFRSAGSELNAGSFAVARVLGLLHRSDSFARAVTSDGLSAVYRSLFGDPFALAWDPLVPGGLAQPEMQLPFEPGKAWAFTGGPHSAWGRTLPWAALDFAPPAELPGCVTSPEWVTAVRDGVVITSQDGMVELDVGDGWVVVYLHIASQDRVAVGSLLRAGDRVGHPSCEGGRATGAHVHISRRYNGEWVPADGYAPFVLSGWRASFGSTTYLGALSNGSRTIEANAGGGGSTRLWLEP